MQHIYGHNTNDSELYGQLAPCQRAPLHPHQQYQHERHSVSPQQSSTSDLDDISPIPSSSASRMNTGAANKVAKKKKPPKKKRKDPNEPQKPVSPYALFFRDAQNDIKKKLTNPSFGEISKVVAHMWENIEPEVKEQYKRRAATAKKEYLKQLAAYRAVQVSHQAPNLPHFLSQTSLSFNPHALHHQQKAYHPSPMLTNSHHVSFQSFCPSSSGPVPHQTPSYGTFQYLNTYPHENNTACHSEHSNYFSNLTHPTYHSYDSNNNYPEYQHYGLLRPAAESDHYSSYYPSTSMDSEHVKTNENLLHNLNNNTSPYADLSSMNNGQMDKQYDYGNPMQHGSLPRKDDEHSAMVAICNENQFHWN